MLKRACSLLLAFLPAVSFIHAQKKDTVALRYSASITAEDLKKHLSVIASDDFEGRETGKTGQKKAADYIADRFKSFGIPPLSEGIYLQAFDVYPKNSSAATITCGNKEYKQGLDFYLLRGNWEQPFVADEAAVVAYGEDSSDYRGQDVKGKLVIAYEGNAKGRRDSSDAFLYNELSEKKIKMARGLGAVGLLIISSGFDLGLKRSSFAIEHSPLSLEKPADKPFPVIYISAAMASELTGKKISADASAWKPSRLDVKRSITIDYHLSATVLHSENVLGYVEGSDLKDQLLVISAHYDHLGVIDGKVYNGADDDGSGTVSVIELAQAFMKAKKEGHGPRRSILFMTVAGEEKGLLGSYYYTSHPVFPLSSTVCDLNIDMVGRVDKKHADSIDYVYSIGSAMLSAKLHDINEQCDKLYCGLRIDYTYDDPADKNRFYYRSDHYNFAKNNIPVIFYFNGTHQDYHRETDEVDKINFALMEKRVKLIFFTAWTVANMDERLPLDAGQKK